MSVFSIIGFFVLNDGHRVATPKVVNGVERNVYYIHYTSSIACSLGSAIPADLRIFSSSPDPSAILPHRTVAFVSAKAQCPSDDGVAFLDAYYMVPFRGDVNDDFYQEPIPDLRYPLVWVIGHVISMSKKDEIQFVKLRVGCITTLPLVDGSGLLYPMLGPAYNGGFHAFTSLPGGQQGVHLSPDNLSPSKRRRFEVAGPSSSPSKSSSTMRTIPRSPSIEFLEPSSSQINAPLKSIESILKTPSKKGASRRRSTSPLTEVSTPTHVPSSLHDEPVFVPDVVESGKKKSKGKGKGKGKERA
ncbi:hypothetical protein H0H92_015821 [Tricholoma furcatifolium]|nr:hypothetical protein H0H92_015821 [Tricholoma furcatifolium]